MLRRCRYVATLEARIQTLERELQAKECQSGLTPDTTCSEQLGDAAKGDPSDGTGVRAESTTLPGKKQAPLTDVAILDMVHGRAFVPEIEEGLPMLPSSERARALLGTAYFYAQARYCIVDWNRLREWHRDRDAIAYAPVDGPVDSQIGMLLTLFDPHCYVLTSQGPFLSGLYTPLGLVWSRSQRIPQRHTLHGLVCTSQLSWPRRTW